MFQDGQRVVFKGAEPGTPTGRVAEVVRRVSHDGAERPLYRLRLQGGTELECFEHELETAPD